MSITSERDRKKDDAISIKIEEKENEGQEVTIRYETVREKKEISTWSWHKEFAVEWSETFLKKKGKNKPLKKG